MKNKGYALLELVICIVLISMVIIQFTVVITKLNTRSHELFIQNKIENNIYNLYGEIGYDFINYNIKSINKIENGYVFEFYQVNKDNVHKKDLILKDNSIYYNEEYNGEIFYNYELLSDDIININTDESSLKYENGYLKLTIRINNEDYDFICSNKIEGVNI